MSGCSDTSRCPICSGTMETYTDYKPVDTVSMICYRCGFEGYTRYGMLTGDLRDERRRDGGLKPKQPLSLEDRQRYLATFKELFGPVPRDQANGYMGKPVGQVRRRTRQREREQTYAYLRHAGPSVVS